MTCRFAGKVFRSRIDSQIDPEGIVTVKYRAGFEVNLFACAEDRSEYPRWLSRPSEVVVEDDDTFIRLWGQEMAVDERSKLQWE